MKPIVLAAFVAAAAASGASFAAKPAETPEARVERVLRTSPVIDGHNDLPWEIREQYDHWRRPLDLARDTSKLAAPLQTDIPRLRKGHVGAQLWSVYIPVEIQGAAAVQTTLEQMDIVRRMVGRYPADFALASTAADIRRIEKEGKIASLMGVEGGHQIALSPAVLRTYYQLGARYMTLTHSSNTEWADSATDDPVHHGLTPFGRAILHEMNRIGMLIDLSHVSAETMRQALVVTRAPVIFSHSSARALMDHPRNVPDDVLAALKANGGVVMVNFYPGFLSQPYRTRMAARDAEEARVKNVFNGQPDRRKAAMDAWDAAHPMPPVPVALVADHVEHVAKVAGVDHVGIGSDYDGISGTHPDGMDGVDAYPRLFAELARRGWSDADLAKLSGGNFLRALEQAERVAASMKGEPPFNGTIRELDGAPK
jgi:membrane dipeptidase